ncbi:MAG: Gfo/Idh/MocA family oxidoreductase [Opitutales bacterium]|nr:Gfo/Idh/MocA family oxidoreductase [Opitutales bacterium]
MENKKKLRCGVIGVGYLGQHHARIYSELEKTELVGVFDSNSERAAEIAAKHGCRVFPTIEALADAADALSVVVPTDRHTEVALPLLERGCHLLIEKPICTSVEDAQKIVRLAREKDLTVQVGHIEHFNPVMNFMEAHVSNPKYIKTERLAEFKLRGTEVGVVLDLMIHDIGIVLKLANSEVESVDAVGVNVLSRTEDIANARIKFKNGCVADLNASRVSLKRVRDLRLFQRGGYMSLDFMNQSGHIVKVGESGIEQIEVPFDKQEPLKAELDSFADCVLNHKNPKVGANLGGKALEIALEITRQIAPNLQQK